ncbi:MAG: hypothetical protein RLZZ399_982 [Verrucomicrobiota bacterium]|jgi:hypothetical protein
MLKKTLRQILCVMGIGGLAAEECVEREPVGGAKLSQSRLGPRGSRFALNAQKQTPSGGLETGRRGIRHGLW